MGIGPQPMEAEFNRRVGLVDLVEILNHLLERHQLQEWQGGRRNRVDLRGLRRQLLRQRASCTRKVSLVDSMWRPIVSPRSRSITRASRPPTSGR